MPGRVVGLRVQGLNEFQRVLRSVDRELAKELRRGLNDVAEVVAGEARRRVPVSDDPQKKGKSRGHLRDTIKARSTQRQGRVQMGTAARTAYAGWIEFGGNKKNKGGKPSARPFVRQGRYLYPAYLAKRSTVVARAEEVIAALARRLDG